MMMFNAFLIYCFYNSVHGHNFNIVWYISQFSMRDRLQHISLYSGWVVGYNARVNWSFGAGMCYVILGSYCSLYCYCSWCYLPGIKRCSTKNYERFVVCDFSTKYGVKCKVAVKKCTVNCGRFIMLRVGWPVWLNGRAFARDPKGRGFESRPVRFQVTALGKLLTRMCLCHQAV